MKTPRLLELGGALFCSALSRAADDLKENAPLPPPETMTSADAISALENARNAVNAVSDWLIKHPGVYWALRRILAALAAMRVSWASEALGGLKALPGALATATIWLPRISGFLKATQPVGGPGSLDFETDHNFKNR